MKLTHTNESGAARMVDVSAKPATVRQAVAVGSVTLNELAFRLVRENGMKKGDVLATAQLAGVMGGKRTAELIPLCHPLALTLLTVEARLDQTTSSVELTATARTTGPTGVEMEALTAVTVAALTVYDMCKAVDRAMTIGGVRLIKKSGGKTDWDAPTATEGDAS